MTFTNKNVRFFSNPDAVYKMDTITLGKGKVVMSGTDHNGNPVHDLLCGIRDFKAWDYDEVEPVKK